MFLSVTIGAFGSELKEPSTSIKSNNASRYISIEKLKARERLVAASMKVSEIVDNDLQQNGIPTGFMIGEKQPRIEIVKKSMPLNFDHTKVRPWVQLSGPRFQINVTRTLTVVEGNREILE